MVILSKLLSPSTQLRCILHCKSTNKLPSSFVRGLRQKKPIRRDGKMDLAPEQLIETPRENNMVPGLFKSYIFSICFCGSVFAGAAIWHYEKIRSKAQQKSILNWAQSRWNELEGWQEKEGDFRKFLNKWWNQLPDGEKLFWPICFLNLMVLASWHHPALKKTMFRYFCSNPAAKAVCWPLVLTSFSHYSLIHFGMNMYVLHSFSSTACRTLGQEQFLAMYLSGGVLSSLASSTVKVMSRSIGPSIGASGAIMALLGYFCCTFPESRLGIVFIPNVTFSAENALKGVMALDLAGIIFRWRLFDHAAHLGGSLFGVFYAHYGQYFWQKWKPFITKWHNFRNEMEKKSE